MATDTRADTTSTADSSNASSGLLPLISRLDRQLEARLSDALEVAGISAEQWRVLAVLAVSSGGTMSEIAHATALPAPSVTRLVDRLVTDSWAHRRADALDRRKVLVFLSARGRTRLRKLDRQAQLLERELAQVLGRDELDATVAFIRRLSAHLEG